MNDDSLIGVFLAPPGKDRWLSARVQVQGPFKSRQRMSVSIQVRNADNEVVATNTWTLSNGFDSDLQLHIPGSSDQYECFDTLITSTLIKVSKKNA